MAPDRSVDDPLSAQSSPNHILVGRMRPYGGTVTTIAVLAEAAQKQKRCRLLNGHNGCKS
jgi:hypothetical protein